MVENRVAKSAAVGKKKEIITGLVESARKFRFCGPSDDLDEITGVSASYRHLIIQFQRLAGPFLPSAAAAQLAAINVEVNNIYSVFEANAELEALLPDIEAVLESIGENETDTGSAKKVRAKPLPVPVCSIIGAVLGEYIFHHKTLERLFYEAGAVGEVRQATAW